MKLSLMVICRWCGQRYNDTAQDAPSPGRPLDYILAQMRCGFCGSAALLVAVETIELREYSR